MKKKDNLYYAIVGASKFAEFCLENYRTIPGLKAKGIWGHSQEHTQYFAQKNSIIAYQSWQELLDDKEVDLIHIASIPSLHAEQAQQILVSGKHVLCEKPLAIKEKEGEKMVEVAAAKGVLLTVDFMMRYSSVAKIVKEIIQEALLGKVLQGYVFNLAGDAGLVPEHWFWDKARSGGIFVEHGVHFFDLMHYWLGMGEVKNAWQKYQLPSKRIDQVNAEVNYANGATVSFYHAFNQPVLLDKQRIKLIFERGEIDLRGWVIEHVSIKGILANTELETLEKIWPNGGQQKTEKLSEKKGMGSRRLKQKIFDWQIDFNWQNRKSKQEIYGQALKDLMHDFVNSIKQDKYICRVKAEDGLKALKLACTAERIAKGNA
jgi:predicted dehydrogenase